MNLRPTLDPRLRRTFVVGGNKAHVFGTIADVLRAYGLAVTDHHDMDRSNAPSALPSGTEAVVVFNDMLHATSMADAVCREAQRCGGRPPPRPRPRVAVGGTGRVQVTLRDDVLRCVVRYPGELDAGQIGVLVLPWPKPADPPSTLEDIRARVAARAAHEAQVAARVSRCLGKLVEAGLVEPTAAPRWAPWFADAVRTRGLVDALARAHPRWPGRVPPMPGHVRLLEELGEKGPPSTRALLGAAPSGARKDAYADLCEWGVVVSPRCRWPTARGTAMVELLT